LSNLSAHRPADYRLESFLPKNLGWEEEGLFKSPSKLPQFGEKDWTDVPKVDYSSGEFNQLSIPEPAEIVEAGEEGGEFVLDDLDSLRQMGQRPDASENDSGVESAGGSKASTSKNHSQARALTLELVKTTYKIKDLGQSERLAREKLKNPNAHSNEDQPFIPTYGESRRALLKKLGFSDDYELSLSGNAKSKTPSKTDPKSTDHSAKSDISNEGDEDLLDASQRLDSADAAHPDDHNPDSGKSATKSRTKEGLGSELGESMSATDPSDPSDPTDADDDQVEQEGVGEQAFGATSSTPDDTTSDNEDKLGSKSDSGQDLHGANDPTQSAVGEENLSATQAKLAADKAFEEGYQKGLLEAKEKAAVQESLQSEIAQKEAQKIAEAAQEKADEVQRERERERKEYEQEIQNLKDKIKSFDESLLGELEKKKEQLDQEMKPKVKVLTDLCDQLKELTEDSQSFFEPLKRLSVHIAEQLVVGELSVSPKVVERLIKRCIEELDMRDTPTVKVELNPLDKGLLESAAGANLERLSVCAVQNMQIGSVRVSVNDTQIEDLIQNRLETIANRLLGQPQQWREHSGLMNKTITEQYFQPSAGTEENPSKEATKSVGEAVSQKGLSQTEVHKEADQTQDTEETVETDETHKTVAVNETGLVGVVAKSKGTQEPDAFDPALTQVASDSRHELNSDNSDISEQQDHLDQLDQLEQSTDRSDKEDGERKDA